MTQGSCILTLLRRARGRNIWAGCPGRSLKSKFRDLRSQRDRARAWRSEQSKTCARCFRSSELGSRATEPVVALDDASFEFERGELVALLGPESGCGKTTLLRIVGGLIAEDRGLGDHRRARGHQAARRLRFRVSGAEPDAVAHGARQRAVPDGNPEAQRRGGARPRTPSCWTSSACPAFCRRGRISFPAACSSASRCAAPSFINRSFC